MRKTWLYCVAAGLLGGCILEDNPEFVAGSSDSGSTVETLGPVASSSGSPDPTSPTEGVDTTGEPTDSSETGGQPSGPGCDDPSECTTLHIGPIEGSCPHQVDGMPTEACDEVGAEALRMAVATLQAGGEGGLVIMHDNGGVPASYAGNVDVPGDTTLRVAEGLGPSAVRVYSDGPGGVVRLLGDDVHLQGFTVVCRAGGEWAVLVRTDPRVGGTETGGHLIETLVMVATRPEHVGSNSIQEFMPSIGSDTVVRNTHVWGYFEGTVDLRFATRSVFSHNTVLMFQKGADPAFDAREVDDLEFSNNVFASLTAPVDALVSANEATSGLVMVGNVAEGVLALLGGVDVTAPAVTFEDNISDVLPLESPRSPRVLSGAPVVASPLGTSAGTSLDGMALGEGAVPGAYQGRSPLTERRMVVKVGSGICGGEPCDLTPSFDNELQRGAWSLWPGGVLELYPSLTAYAGPVVVSWPITLRGMGAQPDAVVVARDIEDAMLDADGLWDGVDSVVELTGYMSTPSLVENLTIETGSSRIGLLHEGQADTGRHEIRRVVFRDDGDVAGDPADVAIYLGDDVAVHDVLVHGGYAACVRFGIRPSASASTPPTTAWVHHLTCRLTEVVPGGSTLAAFEVASLADGVIADVAVDLAEPGPLFRAQRQSSDDEGAVALDPPLSFVAHSIAARGHDALYDGFTDLEGMYDLTAIDTVGVMEPFFVGPADSHLEVGAVGIDGGVDPSGLEPGLSLGVAVDGVDRTGRVPDRGAYEQGQ